MDRGNSGIHIITAITLSLSGCTLLFFAFLRNARTDSNQTAQHNEPEASPSKPSLSSRKKKVRFSEEVAEPSGDNVEYRKRRGAKKIGKSREHR